MKLTIIENDLYYLINWYLRNKNNNINILFFLQTNIPLRLIGSISFIIIFTYHLTPLIYHLFKLSFKIYIISSMQLTVMENDLYCLINWNLRNKNNNINILLSFVRRHQFV